MNPFPVTLLIWIAFSLAARSEELPLDYPQPGKGVWKDMTVPLGATASLVLPSEAMIGEQIPAKLVIKNSGDKPFELTTGGDYRATGFPQRMKVRVRDDQGRTLRELSHENYGMGGGGLMGGPPTIDPGASHEIEFPLERYVSFLKPGTYTVTAGHDLGWQKDKERPHPLGIATISVTEPTTAQASALVESIVAGKQITPTPVAFQGRSYPPMRAETADYVTQAKLCVLRHPSYLAALKEAAGKDCVEAVSGLGHIATAEATEALIGLLGQSSPGVQSEALSQLVRRLPSMSDPSKPAQWGWGDVFQIDPLLPDSWKPEFEVRLVAAATTLLGSADMNVVSAAAQIIQGRGGEECAPALIAALQTSLNTHRTLPREERGAMHPPMPEPALLAALDTLRNRGWRAEQPGGTAQMVVWFRQLRDQDIPKPETPDRGDSMLTWVSNGPATLKENALLAIPLPLSEAAIKAVLVALEDEDPRVLQAACQVAENSKLEPFVEPLIQIIETERIQEVHRSATSAAAACGAKMALWKAVAGSLVVKEHLVDGVAALIDGTIQLPRSGGSGGNSNFTRDQRFAIRNTWLAFLAKHEKLLSNGDKLPLPDANTSAALTGANLGDHSGVVQYHLKDGSDWPVKSNPQ